jgi:hypothetical protein
METQYRKASSAKRDDPDWQPWMSRRYRRQAWVLAPVSRPGHHRAGKIALFKPPDLMAYARVVAHEAGHAAVCHFMKRQFVEVHVDARKLTGYVRPAARPFWKDGMAKGPRERWQAYRELVILWGGLAGEKVLMGTCNGSGTYQDTERLGLWLGKLCADDPMEWQELCFAAMRHAQQLLEDNQPAVERLAGTLYKWRSMSGSECTRVLQGNL